MCLSLNFLQLGQRIVGNVDFKVLAGTFMFSLTWTLCCFISVLYLCNTQVSTSFSVKQETGKGTMKLLTFWHTHMHAKKKKESMCLKCLLSPEYLHAFESSCWVYLQPSWQVQSGDGKTWLHWELAIQNKPRALCPQKRKVLLQSNLLLLGQVCFPLRSVI